MNTELFLNEKQSLYAWVFSKKVTILSTSKLHISADVLKGSTLKLIAGKERNIKFEKDLKDKYADKK